MDRRKFLGALNAGGLAVFCGAELPLETLAAADRSDAESHIFAKPLIRISWESSLGPMLYDHSYLPIPGKDPRTRPNLDLRDIIQWKTSDTALWVTSVPVVEEAADRGRWITAHREGSLLIQSELNQRVDAFVDGADALIAIVRLGQRSAIQQWYLAAVAQAMRKHGLPGMAMATSPQPFQPKGTDRDAQSHLDVIKSIFDVVIVIDLTKIVARSDKIPRNDTYAAVGSFQRCCIATLCAELAGHHEVAIDSLRNRLCESINALAGA